MTVVVTVNVEGRYRGFLASAMLEIAPGRVHLSADDGWHTGTGVGRPSALVLRVEAGLDCNGRGATPHLLGSNRYGRWEKRLRKSWMRMGCTW